MAQTKKVIRRAKKILSRKRMVGGEGGTLAPSYRSSSAEEAKKAEALLETQWQDAVKTFSEEYKSKCKLKFSESECEDPKYVYDKCEAQVVWSNSVISTLEKYANYDKAIFCNKIVVNIAAIIEKAKQINGHKPTKQILVELFRDTTYAVDMDKLTGAYNKEAKNLLLLTSYKPDNLEDLLKPFETSRATALFRKISMVQPPIRTAEKTAIANAIWEKLERQIDNFNNEIASWKRYKQANEELMSLALAAYRTVESLPKRQKKSVYTPNSSGSGSYYYGGYRRRTRTQKRNNRSYNLV